jgi:hypothetical protein
MAAVDPGGSGGDGFDPNKRQRLAMGHAHDYANPLGGWRPQVGPHAEEDVPSLAKLAAAKLSGHAKTRLRRYFEHVPDDTLPGHHPDFVLIPTNVHTFERYRHGQLRDMSQDALLEIWRPRSIETQEHGYCSII